MTLTTECRKSLEIGLKKKPNGNSANEKYNN